VRRAGPYALAVLVLALVLPEAGLAASGPKVTRVAPTAAVPGAAVSVRGTGLSGKGTRVTIGGKTAKVLKAGSKELRVVVPKSRSGPQKVVVKRGKRSSSGKLKVLKPFAGKITAKPDTKRSKSATLGPGGGEVAATGADGTRYVLAIPPGALASEAQIGVTPIARFSGLPFSGKAVGAEMTPDGQQFLSDVTLTITTTKALPAKSVGFGYGNTTRVMEVQKPTGSGRTRVLRIRHFSSGAVAGSDPADFANAAAPLLVERPMREDVITRLLDLIAVYEEAFPPAFCVTQPACGNAKSVAITSLNTRISQRCASPDTLPAISAVRDLVRMQAMREQLEATDDPGASCREQVMKRIFDPAKANLCGPNADPLARRALIVNSTLEEAGTSDLDGDGEVTHLEYMHFLVPQLAEADLTTMQGQGNGCFTQALEGLPARGRALCATDRPAAEVLLDKALRYARALASVDVVLQPYIDALDFCRAAVSIVPGSVSLLVGDQQEFTATVSGLIDEENNGGVTWSATGGSINQAGKYTASLPGTFEVKATSQVNPARFATATVVVSPGGQIQIASVEAASGGGANLGCNGGSPFEEEGAPGDGDRTTAQSFSSSWEFDYRIACRIYGDQTASGNGTGSHSVSVGTTVTTMTAAGSASISASGNQKFESASATGFSGVEFIVVGNPVSFELSGSGTSSAPATPSGRHGAGVTMGPVEAGPGAVSESGTLQPGRYVFSPGAACDLFFAQNLSTTPESHTCSFNYSYTLTLRTST